MKAEEKIAMKIKERTGKDVVVTKKKVMKNNVARRCFEIGEPDSRIRPMVYFDGNITADVIDEVVNTYVNTNPETAESFLSIAESIDKDFVYKNVYPCLIGYEANKDMIESNDVYFEEVLDMAVVYRVRINDNATFKLTNTQVKMYDLDVEEVKKSAYSNLNSELFLMSMIDTLVDTMRKSGRSEEEIEEAIGFAEITTDNDMYVASNFSRCNGASSILSEDLLAEAHKRIGSDEIIILPSSIHEAIIVPYNADKIDELKETVVAINATELDPKDKLTDSVYYHKVGCKLEVAA